MGLCIRREAEVRARRRAGKIDARPERAPRTEPPRTQFRKCWPRPANQFGRRLALAQKVRGCSGVSTGKRDGRHGSILSGVTLAIAITGAATGILALALDLTRFLRERPRLTIEFTLEAGMGEPPVVGIDVKNRGAAPTTIMKAALVMEGGAEISKDGVVVGRGKLEEKLSDGELAVVPAHGGVVRFRKPIVGWPGLLAIDEPVRPRVDDAHGRTTWGPPVQLMRRIVSIGWQPPPDTDPQLLEPASGRVIAKAVEPRWKIWKPSSLRRDTVWAPEAPPH